MAKSLLLILFPIFSFGQIIDKGLEYSFGAGISGISAATLKSNADYHLDIAHFGAQYRLQGIYHVVSAMAGYYLVTNSESVVIRISAMYSYFINYNQFRVGGAVNLAVTDRGHWLQLGGIEVCGGVGGEYNGGAACIDIQFYIRKTK